MADEGFHEIHLNGKQLVFLFMAATVVAVVIFLCGVMVGRGVRDQRGAELAAIAAEAPVDPTAGAQVRRATEPVGTSASAESTPAPAQETLSYPNRLSGNAPSAETMKPQVTQPAPVASAPPAGPPDEPSGVGFAVQVAAVRERDEAHTIAKRLLTKGYPAYVMAPVTGTPPVFRVRVGKYRDRDEAEQVSDRLEKEEQFKPWITR
jgi:cell division septation protein DedD